MENDSPVMADRERLKILMLHNRYQYGGGEDISTLQEVQMLQKNSQIVELVEWSNDRINSFSLLDKARLFFSSSWNSDSARWLALKLAADQPDILHVQNFFPLFSPSIHKTAHRMGIPTVQHLRNFRLACLNSYLFRQEKVCEACVGRNPWRGVWHRCYRESLPASISVWQMITFNRWRKTWHRDIDAFVTPSQFAAQKLVEIGLPEDRLYVKPNFVADPLPNRKIQPLPDVPTFLYVGRLSPEKGILTMLKAWQRLNQPDWQLILVGAGQQRDLLESFCQEKQLDNVVFRGYQTSSTVLQLMQQATTVLVPSQWYETFGRVVIEAFACGRTVLISDLGALGELVEDEVTGLKIGPENVGQWSERLQWCGTHQTEIEDMGRRARSIYLQKYTPDANYHQLLEIYQKVGTTS